VRHGHTGLNDPAHPRLRAWENAPLEDEGRAQIQLTANKLKIYSPKIVYSSDLARDSQSGMMIAEILGNIPYEMDFGLRTADMGTLTGMKEEDVMDRVRRWYERPSEPAPSGDSFNGWARRYWGFMEPKLELARDVAAFRPSVFVTHGRNLAYLDSIYRGVPQDEAVMPYPGGYGTIRSNPEGIDDWKIYGETEPILADI